MYVGKIIKMMDKMQFFEENHCHVKKYAYL